MHTQGNNFQAVVVTNGLQSYSVLTYQCGELNWVQRNKAASIGFSASSELFANDPLSRHPNVNDIACRSQQCPPWTNVVYQINKEIGDEQSLYFLYKLFVIIKNAVMVWMFTHIVVTPTLHPPRPPPHSGEPSRAVTSCITMVKLLQSCVHEVYW